MTNTTNNFCHLGLAVIETEAQAIANLSERINQDFARACELLLACSGRIIVLGMGKSGYIAGKIAATLASTGSPAFFVHPGEASHGDMGMITRQDVVIAISNSGHTKEIALLLPLIKRLAIPIIALTGDAQSPLANAANVHLDISVEQEACPLGLAPTTSTTAALVMGDALSIALLTARGFTADDFALSHPGGQLGQRLLLRVADIMVTDDALPKVTDITTLSDALIEITHKKLGMTMIVDKQQRLLGVFTDGDLRRVLNNNLNVHTTIMREVMTPHCKTIQPDTLAAEALTMMEQSRITSLVVLNDKDLPVGIIHMHHLLQAGIV